MWSLFENTKNADGTEIQIELKPKLFSNGKTQEDVVKEAVDEMEKGTRIIFIDGKCGTGKSAVALNIAKETGKASIVVPIKNLQRQYENDYMRKKFLLKNNSEKLKISMVTGRKNHICPYLEENKESILSTRIKEKNLSLFDIFQNIRRKSEADKSCDNIFIPCKIEIKNKNIQTLKKYYNENPEKFHDFENLDLKTMKRLAIAPACAYWSPVFDSRRRINLNCQKKEYKSVFGSHFIYLRKEGCPYYKQFLAYSDSDVIIFNSDMYLLETEIGRKPATEIEIIDECDEFLDSLALEGSINLSRLKNELSFFSFSEEWEKFMIELVSEEIIDAIEEGKKFFSEKDNIIELKKTKVAGLIKSLVNNEMLDLAGEESYLEHCVEEARRFYEIMDDVYISFSKDKKGDCYVKLVTINIDKLLSSLIKKNKIFVFMSGTLHSEKVLREVFGLKEFKVIEAEGFNPGTITRLKTGLEKDFKFENFERKKVTREDYLKALDKCIEIAKTPVVVQVSAFSDLPSEEEILQFNLKNLVSSEELIEQQKNDREGKIVRDFKEGKTKILFTTRCTRGIDFPFSTCNSVVVTKFPYPNTQSLFWKILKKNKPNIFWDFYLDKAHRELLQRIYRSVRANDDHVFLLSPDIRVLNSDVV